MAQRTIYICDICGKEKTPKGGIRLDDFNETKPKCQEFHDVCLQCFNRIKGYVNDIRNESNTENGKIIWKDK